IVGVVSDEPQQGFFGETAPQVYDAEGQEETWSMTIAVRSDRPSDDVIALLRSTVRGLDPQLALVDAEPFPDRIGRLLAPQRLTAALTGAFSGIGLMLAAIGVYGVVAYAVTTRRREVGVRLACGATPGAIVRLLLRQHLRIVAAGLAVGAPVALILLTVL